MYIFVIWERKALNWTCIILYIHQKESFKCKTLNWTSICIHQKEIIQHGWRSFCWASKLWRIKRSAFWRIFDKKLNLACCKFWIRCNLVWWIRCGCTDTFTRWQLFLLILIYLHPPIQFTIPTIMYDVHHAVEWQRYSHNDFQIKVLVYLKLWLGINYQGFTLSWLNFLS